MSFLLFAPLLFSFTSDAVPSPPTKEPTYANAPQYLLLHFGMKVETRIWLVLDGERLFVDRNGDGDLTQSNEVVKGTKADDRLTFEIGEIREKDRVHRDLKLSIFVPHKDSGLGRFPHWRSLKAKDPNAKMVSVEAQIDRRGLPGYSEPTHKDAKRTWSQDASNDIFGCLQFASSPREASIVQFNGPLSLGLQMPYLDDGTYVAGATTELESGIGCCGRGAGSFAFIAYDPVPKTAHPSVEVKWPGDSPLERMTLGERC